jgi:hypothetical protein
MASVLGRLGVKLSFFWSLKIFEIRYNDRWELYLLSCFYCCFLAVDAEAA